jgi:replicative DNA helicase
MAMNRMPIAKNPDRLPPHDEGAEQGVLGCCLLSSQNIPKCLEKFAVDGGRTREVFYDLRHQCIFEALCELYLEGKGVDTITLQGRLRDKGELDQVGGVVYLMGLEECGAERAEPGHVSGDGVEKLSGPGCAAADD